MSTKREARARKRGAGEGSIYRRADGRWCGAATVGRTPTGQQRRRVVYGATRAEAAEKLRGIANAVVEGSLAEPGRLRVEDLVKRYVEHKRGTVRPRVLEGYDQRLRVHVLPLLGSLPLRQLAAVHVLDLAASLRTKRREVAQPQSASASPNPSAKVRKGPKKPKRPKQWKTLAPRTQRDALDVFARVLDFGVRAGLLPRNPARGIDRPKIEAPRIRSLSAEEARSLLGKARETAEPWVEAAVALGLCGLRLGETFGLTWGDVDLRAGRLRVRQAVAELQDGTRQIGPLKTKSARRELPLPVWASSALERHRASLGASPHPSRLVFLTEAGTPIRMSNFRRRGFEPLVERAGLLAMTYHALRHTAATLLLASGADVKSAQRVLGHAKASHTLDLYADYVPDRVDDAMARLAEMLQGRVATV